MVCFCLRDWKELDQSQKPLCTVYTTFEMTSCYRKDTKSGRLDADMNCMFYNRASTVDCLRKVGMLCDSSMERFCLISFKTHFCFCFGFSVYSYLWRTANVCAHSCLFWNKKKANENWSLTHFQIIFRLQWGPNDSDLIGNVAYFIFQPGNDFFDRSSSYFLDHLKSCWKTSVQAILLLKQKKDAPNIKTFWYS